MKYLWTIKPHSHSGKAAVTNTVPTANFNSTFLKKTPTTIFGWQWWWWASSRQKERRWPPLVRRHDDTHWLLARVSTWNTALLGRPWAVVISDSSRQQSGPPPLPPSWPALVPIDYQQLIHTLSPLAGRITTENFFSATPQSRLENLWRDDRLGHQSSSSHRRAVSVSFSIKKR